MIPVLHRVSAALALLLVACFWSATALAEAFAPVSTVVQVKMLIPYGFLALVPAMACAGATGMRLARGRGAGVIVAKRRRMPVIAANGAIVLIPSALFLSAKAQAGELDAAFMAVQALELAAGALNLTLLGLNLRDGLRLTRGRRRAA